MMDNENRDGLLFSVKIVKLDKAREINTNKEDIYIFREATMRVDAYLSKSHKIITHYGDTSLILLVVPLKHESDLAFSLLHGARLEDFVTFSELQGYPSFEKALNGECILHNVPIKLRVTLEKIDLFELHIGYLFSF
jgi:hypothetical protein